MLQEELNVYTNQAISIKFKESIQNFSKNQFTHAMTIISFLNEKKFGNELLYQ